MNRERYERYITSPQWEQVRRRTLRLRGRRCQACRSTENLHVHHGTYERFEHELDADLFVLCEGCHDAVHRFQRFTKLDLMEATTRFLAYPERCRVQPSRKKAQRPAPYRIVAGVKRYRPMTQEQAAASLSVKAKKSAPDPALEALLLERLDSLSNGGNGG